MARECFSAKKDVAISTRFLALQDRSDVAVDCLLLRESCGVSLSFQPILQSRENSVTTRAAHENCQGYPLEYSNKKKMITSCTSISL